MHTVEMKTAETLGLVASRFLAHAELIAMAIDAYPLILKRTEAENIEHLKKFDAVYVLYLDAEGGGVFTEAIRNRQPAGGGKPHGTAVIVPDQATARRWAAMLNSDAPAEFKSSPLRLATLDGKELGDDKP